MLFKLVFVVLVAWFLGLVGVGGLTHVPLLVGLMLLLLAVSGLATQRCDVLAIAALTTDERHQPVQDGPLHP